ncbi:MAG: hypothetical protein ACI9BD_000980 [Candidatus Marinamargulisbacteria bacterium]|jgi:hypothetical protein
MDIFVMQEKKYKVGHSFYLPAIAAGVYASKEIDFMTAGKKQVKKRSNQKKSLYPWLFRLVLVLSFANLVLVWVLVKTFVV